MTDLPLPQDHAEAAAEALRALNHATLQPDGYPDPADLDATIAALETLAARIPQALRQAEAWLTRHAEGLDTTREGVTGRKAAADACVELLHASADAAMLAQSLRAAHALTATLYPADESPGE